MTFLRYLSCEQILKLCFLVTSSSLLLCKPTESKSITFHLKRNSLGHLHRKGVRLLSILALLYTFFCLFVLLLFYYTHLLKLRRTTIQIKSTNKSSFSDKYQKLIYICVHLIDIFGSKINSSDDL